MEMIVLVLILWIIFGALGYAVASNENKGVGIMLGVLLGPIGILIAAVMRR